MRLVEARLEWTTLEIGEGSLEYRMTGTPDGQPLDLPHGR